MPPPFAEIELAREEADAEAHAEPDREQQQREPARRAPVAASGVGGVEGRGIDHGDDDGARRRDRRRD